MIELGRELINSYYKYLEESTNVFLWDNKKSIAAITFPFVGRDGQELVIYIKNIDEKILLTTRVDEKIINTYCLEALHRMVEPWGASIIGKSPFNLLAVPKCLKADFASRLDSLIYANIKLNKLVL